MHQWTWPGESAFPEDHPSTLVADITGEFTETTSDIATVLDACLTKDLTLVDAEWREAQATQLERESERVALLVRNACVVLRTLTFEEQTT